MNKDNFLILASFLMILVFVIALFSFQTFSQNNSHTAPAQPSPAPSLEPSQPPADTDPPPSDVEPSQPATDTERLEHTTC